MVEISIQPFINEDIPKALALWEATEHIGLSNSDSPAQLAAYLARNAGLSFVAAIDGKFVGAILCGHDGRRGFIHHLAVAADHRRAGIGRTLLNHSIAALKKAGILKCHAFVFRSNPYTELFWGTQGWTRREELVTYSQYIEADL